MLALVTEPGVAHSTRVADIPEPDGDGVLLRVLEVGVCGTDREISEGLFGVPAHGTSLVLGHESLARVERDGHGFSKGDLVTATVRRSCHHCLPCGEGAPDSCLTGDYSERGITRLDGFARELVVEDPKQLVPIPAGLGRLGVLAEPTSICERAIRHSLAIGGRQPWQLERALVVGAGAIGTISTYLLRLAGLDVWTASLETDRATRHSFGCALRLDQGDLAQGAARGGRRLRPRDLDRAATRSCWPTRSACCAAAASRACSGSTGASSRSRSTAR